MRVGRITIAPIRITISAVGMFAHGGVTLTKIGSQLHSSAEMGTTTGTGNNNKCTRCITCTSENTI